MIGVAHLAVSLVLVVAGVFVTFGVGPALMVAGVFSFGVWISAELRQIGRAHV